MSSELHFPVVERMTKGTGHSCFERTKLKQILKTFLTKKKESKLDVYQLSLFSRQVSVCNP